MVVEVRVIGASLCLATGGMEPTVHEDLSAVYCERAQCSAVYAIVCGRAYNFNLY